MDKKTKQFLRDYLKYRKMQVKLIKLRSAADARPSAANVQPVKDQMQKINWHLADMDKAANELLGIQTKPDKNDAN